MVKNKYVTCLKLDVLNYDLYIDSDESSGPI